MNLRLFIFKRIACCSIFVGLAGFFSQLAKGQSNLEISWGSSIITQKMILEDGSVIDPNSLIAEVGSFGSFVPTFENIGQWMDNWKVFDAISPAASDPDGSDFFVTNSGDPTLARYAGSAHLIDTQLSDSEDAAALNPTATFAGNEQGYVFFRTSDSLDSSSQWLLFTSLDDSDGVGLADSVWQFPNVEGGQAQFSLAWWLDQADTAIVGSIHGGSGNGGDTGGGLYSDPSTNYAIRLHSVPEPSTSSFLLLAAGLLFRGARRATP